MTGIIVHEWIERQGGSELVLDELASIFPDAPIYCLWNDAPERFDPGRVHESWIARTPLRKHKALALLFMPFVWRAIRVDFKPDWILSSSHLFAHHIRARNYPSTTKYCYVHSPARYIWSPDLDMRGKSFSIRLLSLFFKKIDKIRAQETQYFAANSRTVQDRIGRFWNRESSVIFPPVDIDFFSSPITYLSDEEKLLLNSLPRNFVLGASRFVEYKRLNEVINFGIATDTDVVIAGSGPEEARLREIAALFQGRVHFVISPSRNLLKAIMTSSLALVFAAQEDFGILPVEAMATGTPVIGLNIGGVSETVVDGVSGVLLDEFSVDAMIQAKKIASVLSPHQIRKQASKFSDERFRAEILNWIGH